MKNISDNYSFLEVGSSHSINHFKKSKFWS